MESKIETVTNGEVGIRQSGSDSADVKSVVKQTQNQRALLKFQRKAKKEKKMKLEKEEAEQHFEGPGQRRTKKKKGQGERDANTTKSNSQKRAVRFACVRGILRKPGGEKVERARPRKKKKGGVKGKRQGVLTIGSGGGAGPSHDFQLLKEGWKKKN